MTVMIKLKTMMTKMNKKNLTRPSNKGEVRGMMVCDSIKDIIPQTKAFVNTIP